MTARVSRRSNHLKVVILSGAESKDLRLFFLSLLRANWAIPTYSKSVLRKSISLNMEFKQRPVGPGLTAFKDRAEMPLL